MAQVESALSYTGTVDNADNVVKAKQFAQSAYAAAADQIAREYAEKRREARTRLAARGAVLSGAMIREDAKLDGEQIAATIKARLKVVIEGYELHGVPIDDQLAKSIASELNQMLAAQTARIDIHVPGAMTLPAGTKERYPQLVRESVGISAAWISTEIDRRRLMKKSQASATTVYHVEGDNSRVNVNSTDNSVNIVVKSSEQIFASLRQQIESRVPEGVERKKILDGLTALEQSQGSKSFVQRYTEFIEVAANHMQVLAPFIPALTELLRQVV